MDRSATGIAVIDRASGVLYANRTARLLLRDPEGLVITGERLVMNERKIAARLTPLLRQMTSQVDGQEQPRSGMFAVDRFGKSPLTVLVAPLVLPRDGSDARQSDAILLLRDPDMPITLAPGLQGLFALTPAEAAVASAIANGRSLRDIAAEQAISFNTVRTHLRNILAKTGTSRQAQLVALLLRSVAALGEN